MHSDGATGVQAMWFAKNSGTAFTLFAITGDELGNTYAVGYNGLVVHYHNNSWDSRTTGSHDRLNAISVGPDGELFAAGLWGLILRYGEN